MTDLKYLNDILVTLEYNIKGLQVVLQKTMSDTYFLKVGNRLVDPDLLYSCTTFIVVTYKPALDVLNLLTISYKCEIMSSCELRYHDIDTELGKVKQINVRGRKVNPLSATVKNIEIHYRGVY